MRWLGPPLGAVLGGLLAASAAAQEPSAGQPPPAQPAAPEPAADLEAAEAEEEEATPTEEDSEEPSTKRAALPGDQIDEDEPEPPLIPPAEDSLAGHVTASASALWAIPFGNLQDGKSQTRLLGAGPGFGAELGIGLSRTVALGVWGQLLRFDGGDDCASCSAGSLGVGAFVRYHLVQGTRFDPWMSAGIGYRRTSIEDFPAGDMTYSGVEWLRLQVGGDWYPVNFLGIGPLLELDMGIYTDRSGSGAQAFAPQFDAAAHWQFLVGARLTLDVPGK